MVLYLKYRPQSIADLVGQEAVINTLRSAIQNGKLSHAYLFSGPRGVGKTSTARILAKMVNCEKLGENQTEICNTCATCVSITNGSCLDVIEIDAASNRGIDDIRDLRDKIKLAPSSAKKKVYIIDEVHMLTSEAFNALLKTLEEPPSHVLFILATTEVHKIPQTILSRVTRINFKEGTAPELVSALKIVVKGEKIDIDDEALTLLAKKSDGSFRDGIKLLDQLASRNSKITAQLVEETLKSGSFESLFKLTGLLAQKNTLESLRMINIEAAEGVNLKDFLSSIMDFQRSLLLIKQGAADLVRGSYAEEKFARLEELAANFTSAQLLDLLEIFQAASERLKVTSIPSLPLEIAVIEACQSAQAQIKESPIPVNQVMEAAVISSVSEKSQDSTANAGVPSDDLITLRDKWSYILEMIKPYNFSLEAMLHSVALDSAEGGAVVLKVPYSFHQRILEQPRNRDLLESVLGDILGKPVKVGCVLDQRPVRIEELANVEVAADDEVIRLAAEIFSEGV